MLFLLDRELCFMETRLAACVSGECSDIFVPPPPAYVGAHTAAVSVLRSQELRSETADLRERIKHLNDMVFCQQRKVKGMIEEVSRSRKYCLLSVRFEFRYIVIVLGAVYTRVI